MREVRLARRYPRPIQYDYLHLRRLRDDLAAALRSIPHPVTDVLDVFCGARPYDELMPRGSRVVGLDVDDHYGTADVVTTEFLPFPDESFDLVTCFEAFHYVRDPQRGAAELWRVLRPGGTALITVPLIWEYDRTILEHRFTGPELEALFAGWHAVRVVENGGRGVAWATFTGRLIRLVEKSLRDPFSRLARPLFVSGYLFLNAIGLLIEAGDRRFRGPVTLPMNLMLIARRSPGQ